MIQGFFPNLLGGYIDSNSSFEMYADKFIEIQNKIFELQEECKNDR